MDARDWEKDVMSKKSKREGSRAQKEAEKIFLEGGALGD